MRGTTQNLLNWKCLRRLLATAQPHNRIVGTWLAGACSTSEARLRHPT